MLFGNWEKRMKIYSSSRSGMSHVTTAVRTLKLREPPKMQSAQRLSLPSTDPTFMEELEQLEHFSLVNKIVSELYNHTGLSDKVLGMHYYLL